MNVDLEKAEREAVRWYTLRAVEAGRPVAVSEDTIRNALSDAGHGITPAQVRKEMMFLSDAGLLVLEAVERPVWRARLTAFGVNVVEYDAPAPVGVGRPTKWY